MIGEASPNTPASVWKKWVVTAALAQGSEQTTAFVNVNVVPMDSERVLENQTVIVEGDRIVAIGPADEVSVPDGAEVIYGNGAYLMPGLADMHMHLSSKEYTGPGQLVLYLAQGTTTIRSFSQAPELLSWREGVGQGDLVGPTIYAAGRVLVGNYRNQLGLNLYLLLFSAARFVVPLLLGGLVYLLWKQIRGPQTVYIGVPVLLLVGLILTLTKTPPFMILAPLFDAPQAFLPESPRQVINEVRRQYEQGVDFVKAYDGLTDAEYLATVSEAKRLGMHVAGHGPDQMPLEILLTSGVDEIAHVDELLSYHWIGYDLGFDPDPAYAENYDFPLDYDSIPQTVALMKDNDVAIVSNMSADETLYRLIFDPEGALAQPEYEVVPAQMLEHWRTRGRNVTVFANAGPQRRDVEMPFFKTLIKSLRDAGVTVTIGTDTGGLIPEGSLHSHVHRELELLVEAGFSNYEALEAGTRNAGMIVNKMGRDRGFGTAVVGQRADLLLLEGNPLESVSETQNRMGVMARGQWFPQTELDGMVEQYVATYQADDSAAVTEE
jgi:imidazolonepropionase-like amidohydrolase